MGAEGGLLQIPSCAEDRGGTHTAQPGKPGEGTHSISFASWPLPGSCPAGLFGTLK